MQLRIVCLGILAVSVLMVSAELVVADEAVPADPQPRWWKGNIHTHSLWSDGNDFPEMIAEWYRTHDYNFLALSDHNVLSEGDRWMKHSAIVARGGANALEKYQARFGGGWVETRGSSDSPDYAVRLKPLNEFRALVEQRGKFIMIQGEEISDRSEGKPVHMNASNLRDKLPPIGGATVREAIANNLRAVQDHAKRTGREVLLHLNHPNFGLAVTAEDMAAVVEERFFEVYNGHPAVGHLGNNDHPGVERLWDIANTLRLGKASAAPMFGVATDDSHKYHGRAGSRPGRGWVMVRSRYLTPEHLIRAMKAGDFYCSSGVALKDVIYSPETKTLQLHIDAEENVKYETRFIGTLKDYDATSTPRVDANGKEIASSRKYSDDVGTVLETAAGVNPSYQLTGRELYVRAVVTADKPASRPVVQRPAAGRPGPNQSVGRSAAERNDASRLELKRSLR